MPIPNWAQEAKCLGCYQNNADVRYNGSWYCVKCAKELDEATTSMFKWLWIAVVVIVIAFTYLIIFESNG